MKLHESTELYVWYKQVYKVECLAFMHEVDLGSNTCQTEGQASLSFVKDWMKNKRLYF